uniref:Uncharacterized protein n=1 Tax=Anguilla anguilla TaxID=7936 RepID=A0A0E9RKI4_ANGAN
MHHSKVNATENKGHLVSQFLIMLHFQRFDPAFLRTLG